jgi:hypothetical protein
MFRRIVLPLSSGLKCVDSGIGKVMYTSYKEVGRETQEERAKKWTQSGTVGRH